MIIRLYTGGDGQAHFEDLNVPAGDTETVALKAGADITFRSFLMGASATGTMLPGYSTLSSFPARWRSGSATAPNGCWTQATFCK